MSHDNTIVCTIASRFSLCTVLPKPTCTPVHWENITPNESWHNVLLQRFIWVNIGNAWGLEALKALPNGTHTAMCRKYWEEIQNAGECLMLLHFGNHVRGVTTPSCAVLFVERSNTASDGTVGTPPSGAKCESFQQHSWLGVQAVPFSFGHSWLHCRREAEVSPTYNSQRAPDWQVPNVRHYYDNYLAISDTFFPFEMCGALQWDWELTFLGDNYH